MSLLKPVFAAGPALWLLLANTSLEAPRLGFVRLENREVWSLRGIAGAFYFGQFTAASVDELAFNGAIGVRISGAGAELLGGGGETLRTLQLEPDSKVLRTGLSAIDETAFIRTEASVWRVDRDRAERFDMPEAAVDPDARLAGLGGAGRYLDVASAWQGQVIVRRVWLDSGEAIVRETFAANPDHFVFLPNGMSIWTEDGVILLRRGDGSTVQVETNAQFSGLHAMGKDLVNASAADGRQFVAQIVGNPLIPHEVSIRLLQLPESPE